MLKNSVSACSTDKVPRKKKYVQEWWSIPVGYQMNIDYDIWCLERNIPYKWGYVEYCSIYCLEFRSPEDLLAFELTFKI